MWIIAIIGFGEKYLNFNNRFLGYASEAVLPFYILHQTVIIAVGYYIVNLEESIFLKYLFVSLISFVLTVAIYDFLIRPFRVMRFLFGVKEIKKRPKQIEKNISEVIGVKEYKNLAS